MFNKAEYQSEFTDIVLQQGFGIYYLVIDCETWWQLTQIFLLIAFELSTMLCVLFLCFLCRWLVTASTSWLEYVFQLPCADRSGSVSGGFLLCSSFDLNLSFSVFLGSVYFASLDWVITLDCLQWFKSSDCVFGWIIMFIAFDQILVRHPRDFALLFDCVCYLKFHPIRRKETLRNTS